LGAYHNSQLQPCNNPPHASNERCAEQHRCFARKFINCSWWGCAPQFPAAVTNPNSWDSMGCKVYRATTGYLSLETFGADQFIVCYDIDCSGCPHSMEVYCQTGRASRSTKTDDASLGNQTALIHRIDHQIRAPGDPLGVFDAVFNHMDFPILPKKVAAMKTDDEVPIDVEPIILPATSSGGGQLIAHVEPWCANAVRVRIGDVTAMAERSTTMVGALLDNCNSGTSRKMSASVEGRTGTLLTHGNIRVAVDTAGLLTFVQVDTEELLLAQSEPATSMRAHGSDGAAGLNNVAVSFASEPQEHIWGLGQKSGTPGQQQLNNKGANWSLAITKMLITIPFYVSSNGYGFLWNLPGSGTVSLQPNMTRWQSSAQQFVDFWVCAPRPGSTNTVADAMRSYADATGHAPMLPAAAAGFWQVAAPTVAGI
jgi:hypothetical protein